MLMSFKRGCNLMSNNITEVVNAFAFEGELMDFVPYGSGHINDTFRLDFPEHKYILQRINTDIFTKPYELMENVELVTSYLKEEIIKAGGNPARETLNVIFTKDGKNIFKDSKGDYWRAYDYVGDTISYDLVEDPKDFYQSGVGFGTFQYQLRDFPIEKLNYTIENFHHTPSRFKTFVNAVEKDGVGRLAGVKDEVEAILAQEDFTSTLWDLHEAGKLPLKVTHNDTKLNNVLIDNATGKAMCVVDLDTVMPGFSADDFGDSIRFGASTALEDEKDLSKVSFDLDLFDVYTKGFLEGARGSLTDLEIEMFPVGAKMLTLETAIRFLTDYLEGDTYFKTAYDDHNLVRARTQLKLVAEMDEKWDAMNDIVKKHQQSQVK